VIPYHRQIGSVELGSLVEDRLGILTIVDLLLEEVKSSSKEGVVSAALVVDVLDLEVVGQVLLFFLAPGTGHRQLVIWLEQPLGHDIQGLVG